MRKWFILGLLMSAQLGMAQDAPPVNLKELTSMLKQIQEKTLTGSKVHATKVIQDVNAAASSNGAAIAFYMDAIRATSFDGQSREQTQFQEWKKKEDATLKDRDMQTATRMHLQYLGITLQYLSGATPKQLMPSLIAYTNQVAAAQTEIGKQEMMGQRGKEGRGEAQKVDDSIFVRWLGIKKMFETLKDWETSPGDIDGIWQKTILPQMRKDKDPNAITYWDTRLQREAQAATDSKRAFNADQFNMMVKPTLLWSRAHEFLELGQRNRAITEMVAVIKSYPEHPDAMNWIKQLTEIITPAPKPAATPATPTTPTAPAAPAVS